MRDPGKLQEKLRIKETFLVLVQVKRDRTMETDRVPAKIGRGSGTKCASSPGKDPAERGRERGTASTSRIAFKGCSFYFRIGNISN